MIHPRYRDPYVADDPNRDPQETAFLHSIAENPDDDTTRLVFTDWLEDHGQPQKAAFVRLEVEMSRLPRKAPNFRDLVTELDRLDVAIGGEWSLALIRPARLANCGRNSFDPPVRFAFQCPQRWVDLAATSDSTVRYCGECKQRVYFCETAQQAEEHGLLGHCIAVNSRLALTVRDRYAPAEEEVVHHLSTTVGEWMPDEALVDRDSPYYRWAVEFFARIRT